MCICKSLIDDILLEYLCHFDPLACLDAPIEGTCGPGGVGVIYSLSMVENLYYSNMSHVIAQGKKWCVRQ